MKYVHTDQSHLSGFLKGMNHSQRMSGERTKVRLTEENGL